MYILWTFLVHPRKLAPLDDFQHIQSLKINKLHILKPNKEVYKMIDTSLMMLVSLVAIPVIMLAGLLSDSISIGLQQAKVPVKLNSRNK